MVNANIGYCDYIILIPGKTFSSQTVLSLLRTTDYLKSVNATFHISIRHVAIISAVRNALILQDLINGYDDTVKMPTSTVPFAGKARAKKVIMIDSDISWTVDDFRLLIQSDDDITVAPYALLNGDTSISLLDGYPMSVDMAKNYKEPFEVEAGGLGFAAVKFNVLEKMEYPWFSVIDGKHPQELMGEDIYFCRKANSLGFKIMCDPRIKPGHVKEVTLSIPR